MLIKKESSRNECPYVPSEDMTWNRKKNRTLGPVEDQVHQEQVSSSEFPARVTEAIQFGRLGDRALRPNNRNNWRIKRKQHKDKHVIRRHQQSNMHQSHKQIPLYKTNPFHLSTVTSGGQCRWNHEDKTWCPPHYCSLSACQRWG